MDRKDARREPIVTLYADTERPSLRCARYGTDVLERFNRIGRSGAALANSPRFVRNRPSDEFACRGGLMTALVAKARETAGRSMTSSRRNFGNRLYWCSR